MASYINAFIAFVPILLQHSYPVYLMQQTYTKAKKLTIYSDGCWSNTLSRLIGIGLKCQGFYAPVYYWPWIGNQIIKPA